MLRPEKRLTVNVPNKCANKLLTWGFFFLLRRPYRFFCRCCIFVQQSKWKLGGSHKRGLVGGKGREKRNTVVVVNARRGKKNRPNTLIRDTRTIWKNITQFFAVRFVSRPTRSFSAAVTVLPWRSSGSCFWLSVVWLPVYQMWSCNGWWKMYKSLLSLRNIYGPTMLGCKITAAAVRVEGATKVAKLLHLLWPQVQFFSRRPELFLNRLMFCVTDSLFHRLPPLLHRFAV